MADKILKELTLKIWRQKDAKSKGEFKTYKVHNISGNARYSQRTAGRTKRRTGSIRS